LSPLFFNMYADVLIAGLDRSVLGCHVGSMYIGCIAYAVDIILIQDQWRFTKDDGYMCQL